MQFKTTKRYHYPPTRTPKILKNESPNVRTDAEKLKLPYSAVGNKLDNHSENGLAVSVKAECLRVCSTTRNSLLDIIQEFHAYVQRKTSTKRFTEILLAKAPNWRQPKCPPIVEWIHK